MNIVPIILCGGEGKRLFPISTKRNPKQFLSLLGKKSLLQQTILRTLKCINGSKDSNVKIITTEEYKEKTKSQLEQIDIKNPDNKIITEPYLKNTAAAIIHAVLNIKNEYGEDTICWIIPSDHYIEDVKNLKSSLDIAYHAAQNNKIVTFGIKPRYPETGYGYIKYNNKNDNEIKAIEQFVEKPDIFTANKYIKDGNYLWNSGMFIFDCKTIINNYNNYATKTINLVKTYNQTMSNSHYNQIISTPFDKAIMEKTTDGVVIQCDINWEDVGCHRKLRQVQQSLKLTAGIKVAAL